MRIKEFIVLRDDEQHPYLKTKTEIEWNKSFLVTENIINFFNENYFMNQLDEEYIYIVSLNCQMTPLGVFQLSHGNWFQTDIKMRELGIFLLLTGAERFIVAHNHPNGSCQPSEGDFKVTNKMNDFSDLIDIQLLQHYVIGRDDWDGIIYDEDVDYEEIEDEDDNEDNMPFG